MQVFSPCLLVLLVAGLAAAQRLNNCPTMWSGAGEYCYQFFKQPLPWQEASNFCSKFSSCATGAAASLLKLDSAQADTRLEKFLSPKGNPSPPNTWIGLGDPMNTGQLTWPDGTTTQSVGYNNFGQGGRNGNCALKDTRTNQWTFAPCTQANSFVCQMQRSVPPQTGGPGTNFPSRPV
ncbi:snaclec GPIB-binding protein subunit beta-like [Patiria miniata]|uniref:C-type lectin domain-containing protein n=1 Tax=Patiria miniata TaxID=46514 RepID=A0A913Z833_PATMI|nr:snaclec GPIB-binding protein subunit beta-like [Patiria miniata]